jgi:hypothetical protein
MGGGNIHQENFPIILQGIGQGAVVTVNLIAPDPVKTQPPGPRLAHHLQGQLGFGAVPTLALRYFGFLAPFGLLHPTLRQEQAKIHQGGTLTPPQAGKHPRLAVLQLAQASAILTLHSRRGRPLFCETRLIQIQGRVPMSPQ